MVSHIVEDIIEHPFFNLIRAVALLAYLGFFYFLLTFSVWTRTSGLVIIFVSIGMIVHVVIDGYTQVFVRGLTIKKVFLPSILPWAVTSAVVWAMVHSYYLFSRIDVTRLIETVVLAK